MPPPAEARQLDSPQLCFHCGEHIPANLELRVAIDGEPRAMCCQGCCAVASLIAGSGLESFYRQRTNYNERPASDAPSNLEQYEVYDDPALAATFSTTDDQGRVEASLLLGGISCAACTWLIEHSLARCPGVSRALVNLQQSRLDIAFDPEQMPLSRIFAHIDDLGYRPRPYHTNAARQQSQQQYRTDLRRLAVAGLGMMQVGMFAIALHAGEIQGMEASYQALLRWVSLPVAGFVVFYSARSFFSSAWRHLQRGALVMDLPVSLAIGMAFAASVWATFTGTGQVYFDSVVMFTFLLLLARFLERRSQQRHLFTWSDAQSSLPCAATVRRSEQWVTVPRMQLQPQDTILIKAGESIPVDARILQGSSEVKEAAFNGEHLPRPVTTGDTIYAGTVNVDAALQALVLVDYKDSRLAALQRSVESAQMSKPRLTVLADRIASWFIAGILLVTVGTALVWWQIAPDEAFWIALSVLVISCPCALALATPAALTNAANALRSSGVIVRTENALESLSGCTHLLFDKTGTLTEGALTIAEVRPLGDMQPDTLLAIGAALQRFSTHPVASAFSAIEAATGCEQVKYCVGAGLEGRYDGQLYRMGSQQFCRELAADFPETPDSSLYWIGVCRQNVPLAWIGLNDVERQEAPDVVNTVRNMGLKVELLTGDSSDQGPLLARKLGIETVTTNQTPQQKMAHVKELQQAGAAVAMVGDGLNDAPVLGLADASFAVSGATDLARSQADFVIVGGNLGNIIETLNKARQCRRVVRQNLVWALGYNVCAIPLAALGFVPPWAAAIGMSLSSLLVVGNSMRLNRRTSWQASTY
ncbi:putative copper-importing P-type ATPase A [Halioglobus japonicus]|nr:putative copper-importing P-type ATPase A [Halioglobus japonicus]